MIIYQYDTKLKTIIRKKINIAVGDIYSYSAYKKN